MRIIRMTGTLWKLVADHDETDFIPLTLKDGVFQFAQDCALFRVDDTDSTRVRVFGVDPNDDAATLTGYGNHTGAVDPNGVVDPMRLPEGL